MLFAFNAAARRLEPMTAAVISIEFARDPASTRWIHAVDPSPEERSALVALGADEDDLEHSLDPDEVGRFSTHGGSTLAILRIPLEAEAPANAHEPPFRSQTAAVLLAAGGRIVTVSHRPSEIFDRAASRVDDLSRPWSLLFNLVERTGEAYLAHLRSVDAAVDRLEEELQASLRNREVLELLRYQKSLVHFTTALASIERTLERLERREHSVLTEEEHALLEDARVEIAQALALCSVAENILSQMMDAFASIISNNLNVVMKVLTAATVILSFPMLLASVYGMNVPLPGQHHPAAFVAIVVASAALAVGLTASLRKLRWL
ncbi:MAG: magnesium transporter CorA family protein [Myxococcales bacterium]|nr:magnesium transporter CorA family protein [Myxococcales bacterium]